MFYVGFVVPPTEVIDKCADIVLQVIVSQVDEDEASHEVKQFQGLHADIQANNENVHADADLCRTVVRTDVAFRSAVEYADLNAVAALESNREFWLYSVTWTR